MVIDLTGSASQQTLNARDKVSTHKSSGDAAPVTGNIAKAPQKDTVVLSQTAQLLKTASAHLADSPEVNSDRVAQLKAAIEDGSYQVDTQRVAEKMLSLEASLG